MSSPFYCILLIFITLIVLQLTLKLKVFFNVKKNIGKLQFKFVGLRIINVSFCFGKGYIKFTKRNGKTKYLPLEINQQSFQEYADFEEILFKKIYFMTLKIYFNFGIKDNAFVSCMVCGYVDILSKIFYSVLKTKKSEVNLCLKVYPCFKQNVIKFGIKAKISLSLFDLAWSFVEAKINSKIRFKKQKEFDYAR